MEPKTEGTRPIIPFQLEEAGETSHSLWAFKAIARKAPISSGSFPSRWDRCLCLPIQFTSSVLFFFTGGGAYQFNSPLSSRFGLLLLTLTFPEQWSGRMGSPLEKSKVGCSLTCGAPPDAESTCDLMTDTIRPF
ncbi:hypothetical protein BHM03_00011682 [Ensete ventricosum]|nr:hypothetical protein BHM03_00011682 [Ensete ventricosum]